MQNNNPKIQFTPKQWVSFGLFFLIMLLNYYYPNQQLLIFLFSIYYFSMLALWRKEIIKKWTDTRKSREKVRERVYFYVTDLGHETDIVKRRKIDEVSLITAYGIFFAVVLSFYLFNQVGIDLRKIKIFGSDLNVAHVAILLVLIAIILKLRYHWTPTYYFIIPITSLSLLSVKIEDVGTTESIVKYFCFVIIMYLIFTLLLPVPYLRKVTNSTLIFGALFSIIVPTLMEHILSNYVIGQFAQSTMTVQNLSNVLPRDFYDSLYKSGFIKEINETIELLFLVIIKSKLKIFSTINFLWLSGYVLGSFIINIKLRLGELRASNIYDSILYSENATYEDLRDTIYFGGETYKNRIIDNAAYRKIIYNEESKREFLKIEHLCVINLFINFWRSCVNKLQQCIK